MQNEKVNYWGLKKAKKTVKKMTNKKLIATWNSIRFLNGHCCVDNFSDCSICVNRRYCLHSIAYEEIVTNELIGRGLFDYAININKKNGMQKLPYSLISVIELLPKGSQN